MRKSKIVFPPTPHVTPITNANSQNEESSILSDEIALNNLINKGAPVKRKKKVNKPDEKYAYFNVPLIRTALAMIDTVLKQNGPPPRKGNKRVQFSKEEYITMAIYSKVKRDYHRTLEGKKVQLLKSIELPVITKVLKDSKPEDNGGISHSKPA